jgi:hypothetical protein
MPTRDVYSNTESRKKRKKINKKNRDVYSSTESSSTYDET